MSGTRSRNRFEKASCPRLPDNTGNEEHGGVGEAKLSDGSGPTLYISQSALSTSETRPQLQGDFP
jgi:hypothetical protein